MVYCSSSNLDTVEVGFYVGMEVVVVVVVVVLKPGAPSLRVLEKL